MNQIIVISRFEKIKQYFEEEMPKHEMLKDAFDAANNRFQEETGLKGYSDYRSFSVIRKRQSK